MIVRSGGATAAFARGSAKRGVCTRVTFIIYLRPRIQTDVCARARSRCRHQAVSDSSRLGKVQTSYFGFVWIRFTALPRVRSRRGYSRREGSLPSALPPHTFLSSLAGVILCTHRERERYIYVASLPRPPRDVRD